MQMHVPLLAAVYRQSRRCERREDMAFKCWSARAHHHHHLGFGFVPSAPCSTGITCSTLLYSDHSLIEILSLLLSSFPAPAENSVLSVHKTLESAWIGANGMTFTDIHLATSTLTFAIKVRTATLWDWAPVGVYSRFRRLGVGQVTASDGSGLSVLYHIPNWTVHCTTWHAAVSSEEYCRHMPFWAVLNSFIQCRFVADNNFDSGSGTHQRWCVPRFTLRVNN